MFNDSRQNAAFMASYVQDRATEYLVRALAFQSLPTDGSAVGLGDWANGTVGQANVQKMQTPFFLDPGLADDHADPFRSSFNQHQRACAAGRAQILRFLLAELCGTQLPLNLESRSVCWRWIGASNRSRRSVGQRTNRSPNVPNGLAMGLPSEISAT